MPECADTSRTSWGLSDQYIRIAAEPRKEHDPSKRPSARGRSLFASLPAWRKATHGRYCCSLATPEMIYLPHITAVAILIYRGEKLLNHWRLPFCKRRIVNERSFKSGSIAVFFSVTEYFYDATDYALMAFRAMSVWFVWRTKRPLRRKVKAVFRKLRAAGLEEG